MDTISTDSPTSLASRADHFIERHQGTIGAFTRAGWLAKGLVYLLFGVSAIAIARQTAPSDEASPQGALGQLSDAPAGRILMAVMAVGLLLYSIWRAASVVLIDGFGLQEWGDRIGYSGSAIAYVVLGVTAANSALSGREPGESSTVEESSRTLLESGPGRWLLGVAGLVTIGVGVYFFVRKALMRSFVDDLIGIDEDADGHDAMDHLIYFGGIVGWIGRGVVTALVGFFVLTSAITFDPNEARGFDQALREASTTTMGTVIVWISAVGLVVYGLFCMVSHRRRSLSTA